MPASRRGSARGRTPARRSRRCPTRRASSRSSSRCRACTSTRHAPITRPAGSAGGPMRWRAHGGGARRRRLPSAPRGSRRRAPRRACRGNAGRPRSGRRLVPERSCGCGDRRVTQQNRRHRDGRDEAELQPFQLPTLPVTSDQTFRPPYKVGPKNSGQPQPGRGDGLTGVKAARPLPGSQTRRTLSPDARVRSAFRAARRNLRCPRRRWNEHGRGVSRSHRL